MRNKAMWIAALAVLWGCDGDTEDGTGSSTSSGSGGSASSGSGGGSSSGTGGSSTDNCDPPCTQGLECCGDKCVNKGNDIRNCGDCDTFCDQDFPFCDNGTCADAPCDAGGGCTGGLSCCGASCCNSGQLCCVVPMGPVGPPECTDPEDETCPPGCPECVCAAPDTPVATPTGQRPIASLQVGDLVYSIDGGRLRTVPIRQINRVRASNHHVVVATLASGATVEMSGPHPTADGRTFVQLRSGDSLAGQPIVDLVWRPYDHDYTYDILPDSDTGAYFAAGALVGSTLHPAPVQAPAASFGR
ncbi:MAG: hypothetical protein JRI68_02065 [Deltaproteobacteria bacterium]|nr:hypothetical protein [Deltaproteobacteria bacterium]